MQNQEGQKPSESLFRRWQTGQIASQPGIATIVLAIVLLLSLLAAQWMVHAHSGFTRAVQNGATLIQEVCENGLSYYLPPETTLRYYIIEDQGKPTSFFVTTIERHDSPNGIYELNEIQFTGQGLPFRREQLTIDNHLIRYHYENQSYQYTQGPDGIYMGTGGPPIRLASTFPENTIPRQLLDFFSSIAASNAYEEGVILDIPEGLVRDRRRGLILTTIALRVRTGGDIPVDIQQATPHGYSVHVEHVESSTPSEDVDSQAGVFRQDIYYNSQHQLVWQKDMPSETILRLVSPSELIETFPAASAMIRQKQNIHPKKEPLSDDEEEI